MKTIFERDLFDFVYVTGLDLQFLQCVTTLANLYTKINHNTNILCKRAETYFSLFKVSKMFQMKISNIRNDYAVHCVVVLRQGVI